MTSVATVKIALERRFRLPSWGLVLTVALIAELCYFTLTNRHFAGHGRGMLALTEQFMPVGILALGATIVILTGNIDLSAGAVASLSSIIMGVELKHGMSLWGAATLAVLAGLGIGLFNGLVVSLLRVDSLLVTLATQFIATSVATSMAGESPPYNFAPDVTRIGVGTVGVVPISLIIFLVLALIVLTLISYTGIGRAITLVGYNQSAAEYSGISSAKTLTAVFTLSGTFAGAAGVVLAAYYNSARADIGPSLLLPAITCVVLGGVDIFGGRGRVGEVVVAVFLLGFLTQGLLISGRSSLTATMVTGLVLIGALVIKVSFESNTRAALLARARQLVPGGVRGQQP